MPNDVTKPEIPEMLPYVPAERMTPGSYERILINSLAVGDKKIPIGYIDLSQETNAERKYDGRLIIAQPFQPDKIAVIGAQYAKDNPAAAREISEGMPKDYRGRVDEHQLHETLGKRAVAENQRLVAEHFKSNGFKTLITDTGGVIVTIPHAEAPTMEALKAKIAPALSQVAPQLFDLPKPAQQAPQPKPAAAAPAEAAKPAAPAQPEQPKRPPINFTQPNGTVICGTRQGVENLRVSETNGNIEIQHEPKTLNSNFRWSTMVSEAQRSGLTAREIRINDKPAGMVIENTSLDNPKAMEFLKTRCPAAHMEASSHFISGDGIKPMPNQGNDGNAKYIITNEDRFPNQHPDNGARVIAAAREAGLRVQVKHHPQGDITVTVIRPNTTAGSDAFSQLTSHVHDPETNPRPASQGLHMTEVARAKARQGGFVNAGVASDAAKALGNAMHAVNAVQFGMAVNSYAEGKINGEQLAVAAAPVTISAMDIGASQLSKSGVNTATRTLSKAAFVAGLALPIIQAKAEAHTLKEQGDGYGVHIAGNLGLYRAGAAAVSAGAGAAAGSLIPGAGTGTCLIVGGVSGYFADQAVVEHATNKFAEERLEFQKTGVMSEGMKEAAKWQAHLDKTVNVTKVDKLLDESNKLVSDDSLSKLATYRQDHTERGTIKKLAEFDKKIQVQKDLYINGGTAADGTEIYAGDQKILNKIADDTQKLSADLQGSRTSPLTKEETKAVTDLHESIQKQKDFFAARPLDPSDPKFPEANARRQEMLTKLDKAEERTSQVMAVTKLDKEIASKAATPLETAIESKAKTAAYMENGIRLLDEKTRRGPTGTPGENSQADYAALTSEREWQRAINKEALVMREHVPVLEANQDALRRATAPSYDATAPKQELEKNKEQDKQPNPQQQPLTNHVNAPEHLKGAIKEALAVVTPNMDQNKTPSNDQSHKLADNSISSTTITNSSQTQKSTTRGAC